MTSPARPLLVVSLLDPALDLSTEEGRAAAAAYVRTRSYADLSRLPHDPSMSPVVWKLRALSAKERAVVLGNATPSMGDLDAVRYALVSRIDGATLSPDGPTGGREEELPRVAGLVTEAALEGIAEVFGGAIFDELGRLAIHRASLASVRLVPFPLPQSVAESLR